jgi:hypothetical protein
MKIEVVFLVALVAPAAQDVSWYNSAKMFNGFILCYTLVEIIIIIDSLSFP